MRHFDMPYVAVETNRRVLNPWGRGWHLTMRPCPRCGFKVACDGIDKYLCNRCGWSETKDVTKYAKLGQDDVRPNWSFLYGKGKR